MLNGTYINVSRAYAVSLGALLLGLRIEVIVGCQSPCLSCRVAHLSKCACPCLKCGLLVLSFFFAGTPSPRRFDDSLDWDIYLYEVLHRKLVLFVRMSCVRVPHPPYLVVVSTTRRPTGHPPAVVAEADPSSPVSPPTAVGECGMNQSPRALLPYLRPCDDFAAINCKLKEEQLLACLGIDNDPFPTCTTAERHIGST